MPPSEANNSPPSEGSGVVSYRLAKRSNICKVLRKISDKTITILQIITLNCNRIAQNL
ncbi:MAG: hypothetical protein LBC74_09910 [Planctomycetaceae bacterium]|nr:hypothetical protein [Planctomycetaceae bacterium]